MKQIAEALALAQGEIKAAIKESENPAFKAGGKTSKYADLTSIWDAAREPLTKNGLSVVQTTDFDAGEVWLKTILLHKSGETIEGRYPLRPTTQNPQGYGSAITYARRYCLAAMVGIVADADDDGDAASGKGNGHSVEPNPPQGAVPPAIDRKAAVTQWANNTIGAVQQFKTLDALNAWHAGKDAGGFAIRDRIAAVRGVNESLHKRLVDAIAKKSAEFAGVPIAAE